MAATRPLNTATLDAAARDLAGQWFLPTRFSRFDASRPIMGREYVIDTLYRATFKDEHLHLVEKLRRQLGQDALEEFDKAAADRFTPRDDALFEKLLAEKLAIRPNGEKIKGAVGTTQIGTVIQGTRLIEVETPLSIQRRKLLGLGKEHRETMHKIVPNMVPVYAGQTEFGVGAEVTNIAASAAIIGLDAFLGDLDSGAGAAVCEGRSGAQPADPDAATTGTLLFSLVYSATAFAGATDQADGTVQAAANAVTDDSSADATGTLGYCRASSTNDGATPLDPKIDGNAATSAAAFVFNTVSIVAGAVISLNSHTVTWSQGSTAT